MVQPAERFHDLLDRLLAERLVADVAGDEQAAPAELLDAAFRVVRILLLVQIEDRHVGAFFREGDGRGVADAAVAAGDDGGFAGQFARRLVELRFNFRMGPHGGLRAGLPRLVLRREDLRGAGHFVRLPGSRIESAESTAASLDWDKRPAVMHRASPWLPVGRVVR